jgi:uncharacterized protein (TIGR03000 family)
MRIASLVAVLMTAALVGQVALTQEKAEKVQSKIVVLVPERGHEETTLTISGTATEQKGSERKFTTPPLDKGSTYTYTFQAQIVPNNYTKITRTKSVTFKAGDDVKVDLTVKDEKTDKIVVRWVPTPDDIVDKMCEMAKVTKDDIIWDLGCGDAVMLVRPIIKYKAKKGVGVDIDPKMIDIAKKYAADKGVADKVELRVGDILDAKQMPDLKDASVVLLYIGDDLGERLGPVLRANLKPGARVVSHRFSLGDWEPKQRVTVTGEDGAEYELLYWVVDEKKK